MNYDPTEDSRPDRDPEQTLDSTLDLPGEGNSLRAGRMMGHYRLLEMIGEGGFGTVWSAEQHEPVKRRVALKIIKLGMDTRQVIARFEAERQALAMMDHPSIAKVFDAGATEDGRPYFVMELVHGVPIQQYCDTEKLDMGSRLELFRQVCQAIQHAHQKGIIHRDIKPSNVLVTLQDGRPVPKVIDFGIIKATHGDLTDKTIFTQQNQILGTPVYMSPEQADISGLDIDTRSDIYSLGVLLYELLTGTTPFAADELLSKGYGEMMRIIREEEPLRPSTRLGTLGEQATLTAQLRRADAPRLTSFLRGDLDWIVMKCLEKDRGRRYESASSLAADIERHQRDEPVLAGPPSARYRLGKFVKRHRGRVIAGAMIVLLLVLGVAGTSIGLGWALRERDRAIAETQRAEQELARATEIKGLISEMLTSVNPDNAQGADTTLLRELLEEAAQRLMDGEITDEVIAAELHQIIGTTYHALGYYEEAVTHKEAAWETRRRVLGEDHIDTLILQSGLATTYLKQSRFALAESLQTEAVEAMIRTVGEEDPRTLTYQNSLVGTYVYMGRYAEAESLAVHSLEIQVRVLGPQDEVTLNGYNSLGGIYANQGRYSEAEGLFKEQLVALRGAFGEEHPMALICAGNLAAVLAYQNKFDEAEALYTRTLDSLRRVLGEDHDQTMTSTTNLAFMYDRQERYDEAESLYKEVLAVRRRVMGEYHYDTVVTMINLGTLLAEQERYAEAEPLKAQALEGCRMVFGEDHSLTLSQMRSLGNIYRELGRFAEAEPLYLEALKTSQADPEGGGSRSIRALKGLKRLYTDWHAARPGEGHEVQAAKYEALLEAAQAEAEAGQG